jgi:hypothetical protein
MIGRLLGHSNTRTTARYAHLADDPVDGLKSSVGEAIVDAMNKKSEAAAPDAVAASTV